MLYIFIICQILNFVLFIPSGVNSSYPVINRSSAINRSSIINRSIIDYKPFARLEANYPEITGMSNYTFQGDLNEFIENRVKSFLNDTLKQAKDTYDILSKSEPAPYEGLVSYKYYINGSILSIIMDYYSYLGGAHGVTKRESINVDTKTSTFIQLKSLFKRDFDYRQYILANINDTIKKNPENYFSSELDSFNENNFYLAKNNDLVIYFNEYEIAPFASGIPEFKMPLN